MNRLTKKIFFPVSGFVFFVMVGTAMLSNGQQVAAWPVPENQSRPWTRWWWPGNAVNRETIRQELKEMAEVGIGGVEITSVYGVKGEEEKFIDYLSPEFSGILQFTIEEAKKLGMGVDLPPGSGWRLGGPFVPAQKGLWSLKIHRFPVKKGKTWKLPAEIESAEWVSFADAEGNVTVADKERSFVAPGKGTVYVAEPMNNGDKVKRAADGGKGLAIDTFDEEVTRWYLKEFGNRLGLPEKMVRCFFHDSFEYTGDFTPNFPEAFKNRRGYDPAGYLHVLAGDGHDNEALERVRSDYRQTLGELVLESFIRVMTSWANDHGSMNRNQAHGSPGNVLDLYAACDIPETEIFGRIEPGTANVFVNKFASSAAHVTGKKLVSSESFTWLEEHWTVTPADMIRATNRLLLAGVNHMFFHGTCYSPADTPWPGWLFYASSQINTRNPLWRELPSLNKYIERSQSILQQATPENDLLVYWPYYDVVAKEGERLFFSLNIDKGDQASWFRNFPLAAISRDLMDAGYSFDYISDTQLLNSRIVDGEIVTEGNSRYQAIVVPKTDYMPVETMQHFQKMRAEGGNVFFSEALPGKVQGMYQLAERQVQLDALKADPRLKNYTGQVLELLQNAGLTGEPAVRRNGFHYLKMRLKDEDWYFILNCGTMARDEWVELKSLSTSYVFYFPENGNIATAMAKNNKVRIQLEPERGVFIRCTDAALQAPVHAYYEEGSESYELEGLWKISFLEGGPAFPGDISTRKLVSWTELGDENALRFAGTAKYSLEFTWEEASSRGLLDLGRVKDCARVRMNGEEAGTLLGPSFKMIVGNLKQGRNLLEVEVTNSAANRIRDMDNKGAAWKRFYDINFVNIDYKPFDASGWKINDAGLTGKVQLTPLP